MAPYIELSLSVYTILTLLYSGLVITVLPNPFRSWHSYIVMKIFGGTPNCFFGIQITIGSTSGNSNSRTLLGVTGVIAVVPNRGATAQKGDKGAIERYQVPPLTYFN